MISSPTWGQGATVPCGAWGSAPPNKRTRKKLSSKKKTIQQENNPHKNNPQTNRARHVQTKNKNARYLSISGVFANTKKPTQSFRKQTPQTQAIQTMLSLFFRFDPLRKKQTMFPPHAPISLFFKEFITS